METEYKRLAAAILNQAADDCKRHQLDAILFLLTDAESYCEDLEFSFDKVFNQARKWYTKICLSESGGTVSSSFLESIGLEVRGTVKFENVKKVAPWFHAEIKRAIGARLTAEA